MKTKTFLVTLLSLFAFAQAQGQELKIATVDMKRVLKEYHRTETAQQELNEKQALLTKASNERQKSIQDLEEEITVLRKQFEDPSLNEARKKEIYEELQDKQGEGIAMSRSLKEYLDRKSRQVGEELQRQMRGILEEISNILEEKAKSEDYDFVFDKSGDSTTQVPVLLYSKDTTDITESLLIELNKDAPQEN